MLSEDCKYMTRSDSGGFHSLPNNHKLNTSYFELLFKLSTVLLAESVYIIKQKKSEITWAINLLQFVFKILHFFKILNIVLADVLQCRSEKKNIHFQMQTVTKLFLSLLIFYAI